MLNNYKPRRVNLYSCIWCHQKGILVVITFYKCYDPLSGVALISDWKHGKKLQRDSFDSFVNLGLKLFNAE